MQRNLFFVAPIVALLALGCQTPKDYTEFRKHPPRSILVLPPLNNSTEVLGGYSFYTTVTRPIAEMGYYVFPVVVVDQFLKENGLPLPDDMHHAPLDKLREVFGADAVLYIKIEKYGSKYQIVSANTIVEASARLVDTRTGTCIWENKALAQAGGNVGLLEAVVGQVVSKLSDQAHDVAAMAAIQLVVPEGQGLLPGPRHPRYKP